MLRAALVLVCAALGNGHKLAAAGAHNEADPFKLRPTGSSVEFGKAQFVQLAAHILARQGGDDPSDPSAFQSLLKRLTTEVAAISAPAQDLAKKIVQQVAPAAAPTAAPTAAFHAAGSFATNIPRRLLFNHKVNLLKKQDAELTPHDMLLRENVLHIISIFPEVSREDVHFWDDDDCENGLGSLSMKESEALSIDFIQEQVGMIKSDICRLAMMYTLGGFYFDTDIVVTPELKAQLAPETTFATVRAGADFFQAFMAASAQHPLMDVALKEFKIWYDKLHSPGVNQGQFRAATGNGNIGTALLRKAYDQWSVRNGPMPKVNHPGGHVSQIFEESPIKLLARPQFPGLLPGRSGWLCDYAVVNRPTNRVVMYSRLYDSHHQRQCLEEVNLMRSLHA